jgi:hypothetical protein
MWRRKERKEEAGSLKTLPLSPFVCQSNQQWLPRLWKPFFYWVGQKTILLQTLAKNRVSAFLYLPLLSVPEIWKGELYIESQKCNNITILNQTKAQNLIFFNWNFCYFSQPHLSKTASAGLFLSVWKSRNFKYGFARLSNHCNSKCAGLIVRSDDSQFNLHTAVTIMSSSVDMSDLGLSSQLPQPGWPSQRQGRLVGPIWQSDRFPSTKHSMGGS